MTTQVIAPGLEAKAQSAFELPYAELTPHFQAVVRHMVVKDAAEWLLEACKVAVVHFRKEDAAGVMLAKAIAKAEGRTP